MLALDKGLWDRFLPCDLPQKVIQQRSKLLSAAAPMVGNTMERVTKVHLDDRQSILALQARQHLQESYRWIGQRRLLVAQTIAAPKMCPVPALLLIAAESGHLRPP